MAASAPKKSCFGQLGFVGNTLISCILLFLQGNSCNIRQSLFDRLGKLPVWNFVLMRLCIYSALSVCQCSIRLVMTFKWSLKSEGCGCGCMEPLQVGARRTRRKNVECNYAESIRFIRVRLTNVALLMPSCRLGSLLYLLFSLSSEVTRVGDVNFFFGVTDNAERLYSKSGSVQLRRRRFFSDFSCEDADISYADTSHIINNPLSPLLCFFYRYMSMNMSNEISRVQLLI